MTRQFSCTPCAHVWQDALGRVRFCFRSSWQYEPHGKRNGHWLVIIIRGRRFRSIDWSVSITLTNILGLGVIEAFWYGYRAHCSSMRLHATRLTGTLACLLCICVIISPESFQAIGSEHDPASTYRYLYSLKRLGLGTSPSDTKCTYDSLTRYSFLPERESLCHDLTCLTSSLYFRIFKVDLSKACPFWGGTAATCTKPDCSVLVCDPELIPAVWRRDESQILQTEQTRTFPVGDYPRGEQEATLGRVERPRGSQALPPFFSPYALEDESAWTAPDSDELSEYVDLALNPEGFTGYQGQHIWDAVYRENCFRPLPCLSGDAAGSVAEQLLRQGSVSTLAPVRPAGCREERVFYRCISGIHASINAHIARRYLFGRNRWGYNTRLYRERLRYYPERIENLYFVYALALRAMNQAAPLLLQRSDYWTGNETEDMQTKELLERVLENPLIRGTVPDCAVPFAENEMFRGCCADCLVQFRAHFRNISKIMDCVGCEKCRLWGKLQFLGLGTAFKILFAESLSSVSTRRLEMRITRNEVVALVNLLKNLCLSIRSIHEMEWMIVQETKKQRLWLCFAAAILCGLGSMLLRHFAGEILAYRGLVHRSASAMRRKRN